MNKGHPPRRAWKLLTHLSGLLLVTLLLTFCLAATGLLLWRLPAIEAETEAHLQGDVEDVVLRLELMLSTGQSRLQLLAQLLNTVGSDKATTVMDHAAYGGRVLQTIYLLSPQGRVLAVGHATGAARGDAELIGSDASAMPVFSEAGVPGQPVWSGSYTSPATGQAVVGVRLRDMHGRVLIGEVPLQTLLRPLHAAAGRQASSYGVFDSAGELIADSLGGRYVGRYNVSKWPWFQGIREGRITPTHYELDGRSYHATGAHAPALGWTLMASGLSGWYNPVVRGTLLQVASLLGASLLAGLLIAPLWARRLSRPLQDIVGRAAHIAGGQRADATWPRSTVVEFNTLSDDLARLGGTLQQRERKLSAIFNTAPVAMAVLDARNEQRIQDVNEAWCAELGRRREDVLGRTGTEIGMWRHAGERDTMRDKLAEGASSAETTVLRGDGSEVLHQVYGRRVVLEDEELMIFGSVDVGPLRRVEHELRQLNTELESRIEHRTRALAESNEQLLATVENLQLTQTELVRAEKMAALGGLVAGVAHELNTPLGNGVMAASTLREATAGLRRAMQDGLRRADLQQFLDHTEQGIDIVQRNLGRAAALVQGFKQVAVDQTSEQRRRFELAEVVDEMLISLRPSFARLPYRIEADLPRSGLRLDSFPGALGQTIGNLIQNAVVHGFDGRSHGRVHISAEAADDDSVVLRVADDGKGISAADLPRIFDPFMTTKKGSGGTGLGLHISFNAVTHILGGTITASSSPDAGTCFELRLPRIAPRADSSAPVSAPALSTQAA